MPNRILHETWRTSRTLAKLSDAGERLYTRLITTADDFGRFEAHLAVVRANCFPHLLEAWPESRCKQMLAELESVGLISLYAIGEHEYGVFANADKYFNRRAKNSKYPAPPDLQADASRRSHVQSSAPEVRGTRYEDRGTRYEDEGGVQRGEQPPQELSIDMGSNSNGHRYNTSAEIILAVEAGELTREQGSARLREIGKAGR